MRGPLLLRERGRRLDSGRQAERTGSFYARIYRLPFFLAHFVPK